MLEVPFLQLLEQLLAVGAPFGFELTYPCVVVCTLCYSVSVALQAPPACKIQQQENQQLELEEHVRAAAADEAQEQ